MAPRARNTMEVKTSVGVGWPEKLFQAEIRIPNRGLACAPRADSIMATQIQSDGSSGQKSVAQQPSMTERRVYATGWAHTSMRPSSTAPCSSTRTDSVVRAAPVDMLLNTTSVSPQRGCAWNATTKVPVGCFSRRGAIFNPKLVRPSRARPQMAMARSLECCLDKQADEHAFGPYRNVRIQAPGLQTPRLAHAAHNLVDRSASQLVADGLRRRPWSARAKNTPRTDGPHLDPTRLLSTSAFIEISGRPCSTSPRLIHRRSSRGDVSREGSTEDLDEANTSSPAQIGSTWATATESGPYAKPVRLSRAALSYDAHLQLEVESPQASRQRTEELTSHVVVDVPPMPVIMPSRLHDVTAEQDDILMSAPSLSESATVA